MRHIVITEDGALEVREDGDPLAAVGPEGSSRVGLHPAYRGIAAWVNDCGLVLPDRYRRNVVGSALLASMGARLMPYAGPVVITNWCQDHEVEGLCPEYQRPVERAHEVIVAVLAGQAPDDEDREWAQQIREYAATVPTADAPTVRIITGDWSEPGGEDR